MKALSREELEVEIERLRALQSDTVRDRRRMDIFESVIDFAIVVSDPSGIVTDWNRGAELTMGWLAAEMIGHTVNRFFTPEDRAIGRPETEMALALRDGAANDERWHMRKDGTMFWASGELMPLRDENGTHEGYVKILRDRTGHRSAGERLRVSEERMKTLLQAVDTAFAIVQVKFDAEDRPVDYLFLETNPAFERQTGADLRGRWVSEYAPDLEPFWYETYGRVALTGEPAKFENYAANFERWFDVRAIRVGLPSERQIAIIFNDVTERKRLEAHREELTRELAHRIKNSLAVVQSIVSQSIRHADSVKGAGEAISNRIAALSRAQDILLDRHWVSADVELVVRAALEPHHDHHGRFAISGPKLALSPPQSVALSLAVHELATNALKYGALSNETGLVSVTWEVMPDEGFAFEWREQHGPAVQLPTRTGFGSRLIERMVAPAFKGTTALSYETQGVTFDLTGKLFDDVS